MLREGYGLEMRPLCREVIGRMTADRDAPRYLARFSDRAAHRRFVDHLRRQLAADRKKDLSESLETFDRAGLVRFRLKEGLPEIPPTELMAELILEEDRKLQLESTKVYLPFSGGSALSFDPGKKIPWGVARIGAPKLWQKSRGRLVKVGVIDTGADFGHPDLRRALRKGINLLDQRLPPDDDNGHGTHIAGTIAARAACPPRGIRGVAPGAHIYPVKAFDREGSAYVSDIVLAIEWCLANRMDIINMSFGMADYSRALHEAVKAAWNRNVTVVASAGNNGEKNEVDFPARSADAIAVGALNKRGRIAPFSNSGKEVDIYAPGEAIYSAWLDGRYNELNGTSMAAAHVTGTIALILAKRRAMTPHAVRRVITETASPLAGDTGKAVSAGRLNAVRAFTVALRRPVAIGGSRLAGRKRAESGSTAKGKPGKTGRQSPHRPLPSLKTASARRRTRFSRQTKTARLKPKRSSRAAR